MIIYYIYEIIIIYNIYFIKTLHIGYRLYCSPVLQEKPLKIEFKKPPPTDSGAEQAIRRMCKPNSKGKCKVSEDIANQFFAGGVGRKELIRLYVESNADKDAGF